MADFMITSRKFKKEMMKVYPEYCFLQTGWNDYEDNNVLAATFLDNHLVAVFYPSLKRAIISESSPPKTFMLSGIWIFGSFFSMVLGPGDIGGSGLFASSGSASASLPGMKL